MSVIEPNVAVVIENFHARCNGIAKEESEKLSAERDLTDQQYQQYLENGYTAEQAKALVGRSQEVSSNNSSAPPGRPVYLHWCKVPQVQVPVEGKHAFNYISLTTDSDSDTTVLPTSSIESLFKKYLNGKVIADNGSDYSFEVQVSLKKDDENEDEDGDGDNSAKNVASISGVKTSAIKTPKWASLLKDVENFDSTAFTEAFKSDTGTWIERTSTVTAVQKLQPTYRRGVAVETPHVRFVKGEKFLFPPLYEAVECGNVAGIAALLELGANPYATVKRFTLASSPYRAEQLVQFAGEKDFDEVDIPRFVYKSLYEVGMKIETAYKGRGKWRNAEITAVNTGIADTYDVLYEDGSDERNKSVGDIRVRAGEAPVSGAICVILNDDDADQQTPVATPLSPEQESKWTAVVEILRKAVRGVEEQVELEAAGGEVASSALVAETFQKGDRVESNYRGRGRWYKGVIRRVRPDGTYDIDLDDGDVETRKSVDDIRHDGDGGAKKKMPVEIRKTLAVAAAWKQARFDIMQQHQSDILTRAKSQIPPWNAGEFTWDAVEEEGPAVGLTPLQLAFALQDYDVFKALLEYDAVFNMPGHLSLQTSLAAFPASKGLWPDAFGNMQQIISLTIYDPKNKGLVPDCIFKLVNLVKLDLRGSGYTILPDEVCNLVNLEDINLAHMSLAKIPVIKMGRLRQLKAVDCSGIKLASPPPEIISQGSAAVAKYILGLDAGAEENTDVLLMLIGDGEAGKTSTLLSLKNTETNTARAIGVDDRTIGIDISDFSPFPDNPLRFSAWDFGGQAVYAIMQQLFMSRRALYPLLWRVRESLDVSKFDAMMKCDVCKERLLAKSGEEQQPVYRVKGQGLCHASCVSYEPLITSWTERLQFRVPGVTVVLIATHIDCATPQQVDEQCNIVAEVAQKILARQDAVSGEGGSGSVEKLRIHNNGQSLRVNNMTGEGVAHLRDQLRIIAEGLDFYGEVIPSSYARLRRKLREMQRRGSGEWRTWILWTEYMALAKECGIEEEEDLAIATQFFHETGEMRYYGATATTKFSVGDKIEARYRGKSKWYSAEITEANSDGTFNINYDDGEREKRVQEEFIRLKDGKGGGGSGQRSFVGSGALKASANKKKKKARKGNGQSKGGSSLKVDDLVEARFRGRDRYYPGVIRRARLNGTYDVEYDDGEQEQAVERQFIRLKGENEEEDAEDDDDEEDEQNPNVVKFAVGMSVEANYLERNCWCPGRITRKYGGRKYGVQYDAGFSEDRVKVVNIRLPTAAMTGAVPPEEPPVEGANGDGGGDGGGGSGGGDIQQPHAPNQEEKGVVEGAKTEPPAPAAVAAAAAPVVVVLRAGAEVKFQNRGQWASGTVDSFNSDGTVNIREDDRGVKKSIPPSTVRFMELPVKLEVGTHVVANYQGTGSSYPGVITVVHGDGTFDIQYDAGDKESHVKEDDIEYAAGNLQDPEAGETGEYDGGTGTGLSEGARVEARYRGKSRWYPAVLSRDRGDGTFDVEYDDGERETRVEEEFIRLVGDSGGDGRKSNSKVKSLQKAKEALQMQTTMMLASTVFPNPFWIVDVLRGLIRHDHSQVLQLLEENKALDTKTRNQLRRRVHRLMQRGLLHKTLLPYIWSGVAGLSDDTEANEDEFRRLIALLGAFDILMEKPGETMGSEWVVPSLSAGRHARTIDSGAFSDDGLPFVCRIVYDALPPYFDMMLIAHIMNSGAADTVDFIEGAASFRKYGDKALLFAGTKKIHNPNSIFRQDQLLDPALQKVLRDDQCHVVISTFSRKHLCQLMKEVDTLEKFFPGLQRLTTLFPCYSCRCIRHYAQRHVQPIQIEAPPGGGVGGGSLKHSQPVDHTQALLDAEALDEERRKDLTSFEKHDAVRDLELSSQDYEYESLARALAACDSLGKLFKLSTSRYGRDDDEGISGTIYHDAYSSGRDITARYIMEVLFASSKLSVVVDRMSERQEDTFQSEIDALAKQIEDRQMAVSTQQAAAELPNLRSVAKFCEKNKEGVELAFEVEESLQQYCPPVDQFLDAESLSLMEKAEGLAPSFAYAELDRETLVPELLYLLKRVTESLADHVEAAPKLAEAAREATKGEDLITIGDTYANYLTEKKYELREIEKLCPEIRIQDKQHYLACCYGYQTPECMLVHLKLLKTVVAEFESQNGGVEERTAMEAAFAACGHSMTYDDVLVAQAYVDGSKALMKALMSTQKNFAPAVDDGPTSTLKGPDQNEEEKAEEVFEKGDGVEVNEGGTWYKGKVRAVDEDARMYVVRMEDGDRRTVPPSLMRRITCPPPSEGDSVEAKSRGGSRYYPGRVYRVNRDDTFDIFYDDGEREASVPLEKIRREDDGAAFITSEGSAAENAGGADGASIVAGPARDALQSVVTNAIHTFTQFEKAVACRDAWYTSKAQAATDTINAILSQSKEQAMVFALPRRQYIESLRATPAGLALKALSAELSTAAELYKNHRQCTKNLLGNRVMAVYRECESRAQAYKSLMDMRKAYGPVWYFNEKDDGYAGGGRGRRGRQGADGGISGRRFVDPSQEGALRAICPAEGAEVLPGAVVGMIAPAAPAAAERDQDRDQDRSSGDSASNSIEAAKKVVQPADPTAIFISHSRDYGKHAEEISKAITSEGIEVQCRISDDLDAHTRLEAVSQAKVIICCLDATYATTADCQAEYRRAAQLHKDFIPVLVGDYSIQVMQRWWPDEMAFLERHSLFVDLRKVDIGSGAKVDSNGRERRVDPGLLREFTQMCRTALVPTVRSVLAEWKSPEEKDQGKKPPARLKYANSLDAADMAAETALPLGVGKDDSAAGDINEHSSVSEFLPDRDEQEDQFVSCEHCGIEGHREGRYDRFAARAAMAEWRVEELERRSLDPTAATVSICPRRIQCSGPVAHEMLVTDLLARKIQKTTLPCPRCRVKGLLPPYCFAREACLAELEYNRNGSMTCKRCGDGVPLFELLQSEVFISYNWGRKCCPKVDCTKDYWQSSILSFAGLCGVCETPVGNDPAQEAAIRFHTQMLVSDLKQSIEEEAGVTCWQDLDRLVGGKDLVREMEAGIRYAEVVVLFLNDMYVKSVNCMKEYMFATKHGKYIIPVILKDYSSVPLSMDEGEEDGKNAGDKETELLEDWWPDSMTSLQQFQPILLQREDQMEKVLFEICERIQSRFHRAQRYATAGDVIHFLRDYSSWHNMRRAFLQSAGAGSPAETPEQQAERRAEHEAQLDQIFAEIDLDGNGFIDADEMAKYLDKTHVLLTTEQIGALFSEADIDCDGQLSLEEFKVAVLTVEMDGQH